MAHTAAERKTASTTTSFHGNAVRWLRLPLEKGEPMAFLGAPFPLTASQWDQMMRVLDAMKPALVSA
jgi:hypothetical protein